MREGFGQTETCIMLFNNPWIEPKPGSMGMPAAGWDVQLLDERGRPVPDGTVGEICVNIKNGRPVTGSPVVLVIACSYQIFGKERVALNRSPSVVNLSLPF